VETIEWRAFVAAFMLLSVAPSQPFYEACGEKATAFGPAQEVSRLTIVSIRGLHAVWLRLLQKSEAAVGKFPF
jgi:hypothetical protein